MSFPSKPNSFKTFHFQKWLLAFVTIFPLLNPPSSKAGMNLSAIPSVYGEVIYRYNGKSPNQLFIIGMSHRDSISRLNGQNTSRVQAEVYKLGEWLIRNRGLELLLPEGFFKKKAQMAKEKLRPADRNSNCSKPLDIRIVEEKLSGTTSFVNAEMLLMKNYHLRTQQVEDQKWYDAVGCFIRKLAMSGNFSDYYLAKSELDYLQERRTAAILQKVPEVTDEEYQKGGMKSKEALLTIGLSHLCEIIKYLNENKIKIYSPLVNSYRNEDYFADLNLLRENFGVSIIIPRTLANDPKILEINGLGHMLEKFRRYY
jgi:hypothetical protein